MAGVATTVANPKITDTRPMHLTLLIALCPETIFANVFLDMRVAHCSRYRNTLPLTTLQLPLGLARQEDASISRFLRTLTMRADGRFATMILALQFVNPALKLTVILRSPPDVVLAVPTNLRPLHRKERRPPACAFVDLPARSVVSLGVDTRVNNCPFVPT